MAHLTARVKALSQHANVEPFKIHPLDNQSFEIGQCEYLVLTDKEADK